MNGPIVVSKHAAILDTLKAAGRYVGVVVTAVPLLMTLIGNRNFSGLVAYFTSADGTTLFAAIGGLITLGYGLYRTFKRGDQLVTVADVVTDRVAKVK